MVEEPWRNLRSPRPCFTTRDRINGVCLRTNVSHILLPQLLPFPKTLFGQPLLFKLRHLILWYAIVHRSPFHFCEVSSNVSSFIFYFNNFYFNNLIFYFKFIFLANQSSSLSFCWYFSKNQLLISLIFLFCLSISFISFLISIISFLLFALGLTIYILTFQNKLQIYTSLIPMTNRNVVTL